MIPKILQEIGENVSVLLRTEPDILDLIKKGKYRYVIAINKEGTKVRWAKLLGKKKIPTFTSEEMERMKFLKEATKNRTSVIFISGLVQQLFKEIRRHHLGKFEGETQDTLSLLYGKTIETLGKELINAKRIVGKGTRTIRVT